jgi:hypothetical protein
MLFPVDEYEWVTTIVTLREIANRSYWMIHHPINPVPDDKTQRCLLWASEKLLELANEIKPGDAINYAQAIALIEYMIDITR